MVEKQIKTAPKLLVIPKHELPKAPAPPPWDPNIDVRYVKDIDLGALTFNAITLLIIAFLIGLLVYIRISNDIRTICALSLTLTLIPVAIAGIWGKLWVSPDLLEAYVYLDEVRKTILAYSKGFHFVAWTAKRQKDVVSFRKEELVTFCKDDGTALSVPCFDGRYIQYEFTVNYNVVEYDGKGIGNSLKYSPHQIRRSIRATMQARVQSITSLNSFEVLAANRDRVETWIATCYGGVATQTALEERYNISIDDPILDSIDLDERSKKTFEKKSQMDQVVAGAKEFRALGVPPSDALDAARSIVQDDAEKSFISVDLTGAPNLTSFALGSGVGAFGGAGGGGGKRNKSKGRGKGQGKGPDKKNEEEEDDGDDEKE